MPRHNRFYHYIFVHFSFFHACYMSWLPYPSLFGNRNNISWSVQMMKVLNSRIFFVNVTFFVLCKNTFLDISFLQIIKPTSASRWKIIFWYSHKATGSLKQNINQNLVLNHFEISIYNIQILHFRHEKTNECKVYSFECIKIEIKRIYYFNFSLTEICEIRYSTLLCC